MTKTKKNLFLDNMKWRVEGSLTSAVAVNSIFAEHVELPVLGDDAAAAVVARRVHRRLGLQLDHLLRLVRLGLPAALGCGGTRRRVSFQRDFERKSSAEHCGVVLLDSPSSPLLAEPVKNTLPSSATRRAWEPSWPTENCTILGDFVTGSSTHLPADGPPCLIPRLWYFPV